MKNYNSLNISIFFSITLLMLGVGMLFLFVLSPQSLRLDESQSIWQAGHTFYETLHIVAEDVHVPLYILLLRTWHILFGDGVVISRLLSLIFFIIGIPIFFILSKFLYNRSVALFATVLFSLSPLLNWYGSETRMYSLLVLLTLINQYFFTKFFNKSFYKVSRVTQIGYVVSAILGVYTHYFFFLTILTQAIFFCVNRKVFSKEFLRQAVMGVLIVIVAIMPWVMYVYSQGSMGDSQPNLPAPTTIDVFNSFSQFLFGFETDPINTLLVSIWPITILLVFLALRKGTTITLNTLYLILALLVPNVTLFVFSFIISPVYLTRYLIFTAPYLYLLISWLFTTYPPYVGRVARTLLVVLMATTLVIEITSPKTPTLENYSLVAGYLNTHATIRDVVVLSAPFTIYPIEYYYQGLAKIETLPLWDRNKLGPIPPYIAANLPGEIETLTEGHQNLWLLQSYDQGYQEEMRIYFDTHFERLQSINFSPKLNLYQYKLRYEEPISLY